MDTPIGRQDECEALRSFLDELATGAGGALLLEGDGGTGKTTLADWAQHEARERGFAVLTGRSWELSQSVQYEPMVAALGRFLRSQPPTGRAELTRGLTSLSTLLDGLDLAPQRDSAQSGSRARLHDAVATLLARAAESRPVLVTVDDLHWTDGSSLEVLQYLCRDLPYVNLGIVATVRPADAEERADVRAFLGPLRRAPFTRSVAVRNLDREQTAAIIRERLPGIIPDRLFDLVWARSIGTPLFVHELLEDLVGRGILTTDGTRWHLHDPDPSIPRVAADLIRDRIERADSAERELLDILAIADEPTRLDVMAAVSSLDPAEIERRLGRLRDHRLVADSIDDDGIVRWRAEHPIISHVIAAGLSEQVRQRLHRRLGAADADAPLARRARHLQRGGPPGDPAGAAAVMIAAGHEALRQAAPNPAHDHFEAAVRFVQRCRVGAPGGHEVLELHFDAMLGLGIARWRLQRLDAAIETLEAACSMAEGLADHERLLEALGHLDRATFQAGRPIDSMLQRLGALGAQLEESADWSRLATVLHQRFLVISRSGDPSWPAELERMLATLRDRPLDARAEQVVAMLGRYGLPVLDPAPPAAQTIDELLAWSDSTSPDWDLAYRTHLLALDFAGYLGLPERLDEVITRTRRLEVEVGALPNWRIALQRGLARVCGGGDPDYLDVLGDVGAVGRSHTLIGLMQGLYDRYRFGPGAAIESFEALCGEHIGSGDRVAVVLRSLGRILLSEGTEREGPAALRAADAVQGLALHNGAVVFYETGIHAYATALVMLTAGDEGGLRNYLTRLAESSDGVGLPGAAIALIEARVAPTSAGRARCLVRAAELFEQCGYHLPATERRIEAAEVDAASVDDELLTAAHAFAEECGAEWLAARARALGRVGPKPASARNDELLTPREWEVAREVSKGLTNREVANELFISIRTVTSHLDHIYTKVGFSTREELTAYVAEREGDQANT